MEPHGALDVEAIERGRMAVEECIFKGSGLSTMPRSTGRDLDFLGDGI